MKWLCPSSYLASLNAKILIIIYFRLFVHLFIFHARLRLLAQIENAAAAAATDLFCFQLITSFSHQIACEPTRIHVWCYTSTYIHKWAIHPKKWNLLPNRNWNSWLKLAGVNRFGELQENIALGKNLENLAILVIGWNGPIFTNVYQWYQYTRLYIELHPEFFHQSQIFYQNWSSLQIFVFKWRTKLRLSLRLSRHITWNWNRSRNRNMYNYYYGTNGSGIEPAFELKPKEVKSIFPISVGNTLAPVKIFASGF